jgi:pimeloyl-ACP methyl ester carboxylesterase
MPIDRDPSASPVQLFYTQEGDGRNVLLLHGWACDSHDWSWQLPVFERRYRVVNLDLRGHGRSEIPTCGYMLADFVADVEELITSKFPGEKFIAMGHSMGGQIAARLAARRPDLVSAVISVDGTLGLSAANEEGYRDFCDALDAGDPGVVVPALFKSLYGVDSDPAITRWHARRAQGIPATVLRQSIRSLFLGPDQVATGLSSEVFCRNLRVPFYGLYRTQAQVDTMRPWFSHPKSRVELWAGAGHWIMLDSTMQLNASVSEWIDAL